MKNLVAMISVLFLVSLAQAGDYNPAKSSDSSGECFPLPYPPKPLMVQGPDFIEINNQYNASGGIPPYQSWTMTCGDIDGTGKVTDLPNCCPGSTNIIEVKDSSIPESTAQKQVQVQGAPLAISGPVENVNIGSQFSASGGSGSYRYSIDRGSIAPETGIITTLPPCGAPGEPRSATVTITDLCGTTAAIEVRLAGGRWVQVVHDWRPSMIVGVMGGQSVDCEVETTQGRYKVRKLSAMMNRQTSGLVAPVSWFYSNQFMRDTCLNPDYNFPVNQIVGPRSPGVGHDPGNCTFAGQGLPDGGGPLDPVRYCMQWCSAWMYFPGIRWNVWEWQC